MISRKFAEFFWLLCEDGQALLYWIELIALPIFITYFTELSFILQIGIHISFFVISIIYYILKF